MEANLKELAEKLRSSDKRLKIAVIIGLVGILLIGISEALPKSDTETKKSDTSYAEFTDNLEKKTCDVLSSIDGVGECKVMITLKNSNESIFAKNNQENSNGSNYSSESEYVLYKGENGEEPMLIKEYYPEVKGVVVVCSGADNVTVRENVINCVSSLYGIPSTKISVSKLK
ncbi:MAG: hypothetical protein IKF64_01405 [Eubacterium sp.]|nr:hypothetical protein [Eubacterium sp.]